MMMQFKKMRAESGAAEVPKESQAPPAAPAAEDASPEKKD